MTAAGDDELLVSQALLLLALHDQRGKDDTGRNMEPGLACGLLLDLARRGFLDLDDGGHLDPRHDRAPTEAVLVDALEVVRRSRRPRDARHWIPKLAAEVRYLLEVAPR